MIDINGGSNLNDVQEQAAHHKRLFLISISVVISLIIVSAIFFLFYKNRQSALNLEPIITSPPEEASSVVLMLPDFNQPSTSTLATKFSDLSDLELEKIFFSNFYQAPIITEPLKINNFNLPLNVKIEVINYYDLSRKIGLDNSLNKLNNQGFVLIDNPWSKETTNFFDIYRALDDKQIPLFLSSDFLIYQQQNIIKQTFKDIEEKIFYNSLWEISKGLYLNAKNRYEERLALVGSINDSVLEGMRLETAFFAVALELLQPQAEQVAKDKSSDESVLFTETDVGRFYFSVPPYLKDEVAAELKLIKEARAASVKSPIFLYQRDYRDFLVPTEYRRQAKLTNFYMAAKWLESIFPLNYRDKSCPNCLLDKEDWRLNFIAANLIAADFAANKELKNEWARIYKVIFFFEGLRDNWNYLHYYEAAKKIFGDDYQIEQLFTDSNPEANNNIDKMRQALLKLQFSEAAGAYSINRDSRSLLGLKIRSENYWPNEYVWSKLLPPVIGSYLGTSTPPLNITACKDLKTKGRCNGFSGDFINLVKPLAGYDYYDENTNYQNYTTAVEGLRRSLLNDGLKRDSGYLMNLGVIQAYLDTSERSTVTQSKAWFEEKDLKTSAATWFNWQLASDKLIPYKETDSQQIVGISQQSDYFYVEPNLKLVDELLANNNMIVKALTALRLDGELIASLNGINNLSNTFRALRVMMVKELKGEELTGADYKIITEFVRAWSVEKKSISNKKNNFIFSNSNFLKVDLSNFKLLVIVYQTGDKKAFAVGPVWDYKESNR